MMLKLVPLPGHKAVRPPQPAWGILAALLTTLLWFALPGRTMAASFNASLDRDTINLGESATLTLTFEGGSPDPQPTLPSIANLSIGGPSFSEQTSLVFDGGNTKSSHQITYVYSLTPTQLGEYVIPEITVKIEGQPFSTQPVRLTVTKAPVPTVNPKTIFLKLVIPKAEVYIGEILPLEMQLYLAEQVQLTEMPHFKEQGFTLGKMLQPTQSATMINNQRYEVVTFKTCVVAAKAGKIDLGPATAIINVPKPNSRRSFPF
ncbi:MAG TPA: BatD family protein, partial [Verrucomicrobiae bacterium]|nr:BatD family protein [Verrucomicrobiae bacterium]